MTFDVDIYTSDINCSAYSDGFVGCYASDFGCDASSNGRVDCDDNGADEACTVNGDGSVLCD